jgi:peptidoglycan/LPS O-acetylase OafA/YrhL
MLAGASFASSLPALVFALGFLPTPRGLQLGLSLYPLDTPAWSLFFEIVANAVWFPLRRWLVGPIGWALLGVAAVGLMAVDVIHSGIGGGDAWADRTGGFARVGFSFLAGVLTYRFWTRHPGLLGRPAWLATLGALLLLFAAPGPRVVVDPLVVLAMPVLVYAGAAAQMPGQASAFVARQLGDVSYAVYVLHFPIILAVDTLLVNRLRLAGVAHPSALTSPLVIVLVVTAALLLDRFYDRPVRRWLSRRGTPASSAAATVGSGS